MAAADARLAELARQGAANALRAWICLNADSDQFDRIVHVTAEMHDAVLGLPVGHVLARQVTTAHIHEYHAAEAQGDKARAAQSAMRDFY